MNIRNSAQRLGQRIRAYYRQRQTEHILAALPDRIRKDIGWNGERPSRYDLGE